MTRRTDGQIDLEVIEQEDSVRVTLDSSQYQVKDLKQLTPFLKKTEILLEGTVADYCEEYLELSYALPQYAKTLKAAAYQGDSLERLEIASKLSILAGWQSKITCLFLHPENLYVVSGQLKVAHRGLLRFLEPSIKDEDAFFRQYKALVVSTIQPKYIYEHLVTGEVQIRDTLSKEILEAKSIEEVEHLLDKQYEALSHIQKTTKSLVKKSSYMFFKWGTIALLVLCIGLGGWLSYNLTSTLPRQERIIQGQAAYTVNNFGETIRVLKNDDPATLPPTAQYILASSYIHLENLTNEQKQAILNNISPNSNPNDLLYWIYSGRGMFIEALDIALNIGDNQLILHAYTRRYDEVEADMNMPGNEKQEALNNYRARIVELIELLEGGDLGQ